MQASAKLNEEKMTEEYLSRVRERLLDSSPTSVSLKFIVLLTPFQSLLCLICLNFVSPLISVLGAGMIPLFYPLTPCSSHPKLISQLPSSSLCPSEPLQDEHPLDFILKDVARKVTTLSKPLQCTFLQCP
jgi:hypothetical protein